MKYIRMWTEENHNYYDFEDILLNYGIRSQKKFGCGVQRGMVFGKDFHAEFYLPEEELKREANCWYFFFMDQQKFKKLLQEIKKSSAELKRKIRWLLSLELRELDSNQLWKAYDNYSFSLGELFRCYNTTQPHRIIKLEEELQKWLELQEGIDLENCRSILTSPKEKFVFLKQNDKAFASSFAESVRKEDAVIDKSLIHQSFYKVVNTSQKKRDDLLQKLKPTKEIIHITEVLRTLAAERFKMRGAWMLALYYMELFLIEFKHQFQVTKSELRAYDLQELERLIKESKRVERSVIERRKKGFLKILEQGKIQTLEGEIAKQKINSVLVKAGETDELKGTIASKGFAKGKVIILSYIESESHTQKMQMMNPGDILVTEMTRPNIIVACEKAGAIVTDEGGLLCHAAIISRELKKPCIIGTKIATKIFKEGDYIEVDANRGIVRKIKSA